MVTILITGITLDAIGAILVAYTVIRVHDRVRKEHHIDSRVLGEMKQERVIVIAGIAFIIIGYILQVVGLLAR
jgi:UPF0716 family protein affecting phage T7 exclusion